MDILPAVNETREPGYPGTRRGDAVVTNELTASLILLYRRTRNRTVGAKHAAIAREGLQSLAAALAIIEELAGIGGHDLNRLMAASRASKR
jgi:hypothetical protein